MTTSFDCSCIIPTHDRDDFLHEAIASVLVQSIRPGEIIVVDDIGSPATASMVERLSTSDVPIRYIDASGLDTKGAGASRNFGARVATKSYLAFLDDDDLWKPNYLEECQNLFARENPALVAVWASFLSNGREFDGQSLPDGLLPSDGFSRNPGLTGSNFIIAKDVFASVGGFDTNLWVSNDRDFLIRFLDSGRSYSVVTKRLALQRVHEDGQLTNRNERRACGIEAFVEKYRDRLGPTDIRLLHRELYSIRRVCHENRRSRTILALKQLRTYHLTELFATLRKKLFGHSTSYK